MTHEIENSKKFGDETNNNADATRSGHNADDTHDRDRRTVKITVNGKELHVAPGKIKVAEIKKLAGEPLAYELSQIINGRPVLLDQDGFIEIKGGEIFVACPATGASS
jgi:hypothetical protein